MAIANNGPHGNFRGSIGKVVYYTLYEKPVARSKPKEGSYTITPRRAHQHERMNLVTYVLTQFKLLLRISFAENTVGRSPYSSAQSYNVRNAVLENEEGSYLDYSKLRLSDGTLPAASQASVNRQEGGLYFEWSTDEGNTLDNLLVMLFDENSRRAEFDFTGTSRKRGSHLWEVDVPDEPCYVYLAFQSRDQQHMSPSLYLGQV